MLVNFFLTSPQFQACFFSVSLKQWALWYPLWLWIKQTCRLITALPIALHHLDGCWRCTHTLPTHTPFFLLLSLNELLPLKGCVAWSTVTEQSEYLSSVACRHLPWRQRGQMNEPRHIYIRICTHVVMDVHKHEHSLQCIFSENSF